MLTLQDAQELVKKPDQARELAAAMIPGKISKILEEAIDFTLINAIAQKKIDVSFLLKKNVKADHNDIVTYLYLLGIQNPMATWESIDDELLTKVTFTIKH